jgi:two-component system, NarL family, nitrate/nitrite response regulator NarL
MSLQLLIADDHPLFLTGMKYALAAQGFKIVAEAKNGEEAVSACHKHNPDVALLDIKMPLLDGIEACRQIVQQNPKMIVLMLTTFDEPGVIRAAKEAGARGYLSKETPPLELAKVIHDISKNPDRDWFPKIELPQFTPREHEVLELLVQGLITKEMAKILRLSPETVKDYLEKIYGKLEVADRFGAISKAQALKLVKARG